MSKYTLVEVKEKDVFKVTITADMNDGDYLTKIETYSKKEFERNVLDELIDLNENYSADYKLPDFQEVYTNIPWDSQSGEPCHTLESIEIEYIDENGKVFEVLI